MPTRVVYPNREQSLADVGGADRGNGNDSHMPIGKGSFDTSYRFRALINFPGDWSGMAQVTKIELKIKLSNETHTAHGANRRILVSRLTGDWTQGGGSENSWAFGSGVGTVWPGPGINATYQSDRSLTAYGNTDWATLDITQALLANIPSSVLKPDGTPGGGATNYGLRIESYDDTSTGRSVEFYGKDTSSQYYLIVTYTTNSAPAKPVGTVPVDGVVLAPGSTPSFSWTGTDPDAGDTLLKVDIQVGTDNTFASGLLWNATNYNVDAYKSGFNVTGLPYAGSALPTDGAQVYWRVREYDADSTVSPWSNTGSFRFSSVPTVSGQTPGASGLAAVWNLGGLAVWGAGAVAGPQFKFVYTSPTGKSMKAYRFRIYNSASAPQQDVTITLSALSGATVTHNCTFAIVNGTQMKWGVEVQDVDGNWSSAMALLDFKVRWGQAIYAQSVGVGAQNLSAIIGPITGTGAQSAILYQSATAADGTGGTAWVTDVGSLAPTTGAFVRVMVRLAATVSGQNPALADLTLKYAGTTASVPDKWSGQAGAVLSLDSSKRRFGYYSAKIVGPTALSACHIVPWRRVAGDGVLVSQDTDYTLSMYVNTNGPLGGVAPNNGAVQLMVRRDGPGGALLPAYTNPKDTTAITTDSSSFPDGWQRLQLSVHVPPGMTTVWPSVWFRPTTSGQPIWIDGGKFEEGKITSAWTPGFLGESITLDALGISVDAPAGGIVRLRGSNGGLRDTVELGAAGLLFGGDTEVSSPAAGQIAFTTPVGATKLLMENNGSPGIELRSLNAGTPYIDFTNDAAADWDTRLVLTAAGILNVLGGGLQVGGVPVSINTHTHTPATPEIRAVRGAAGGSLAFGANGSYTITWPTPFADTNYTVSITIWTEAIPAGRLLTATITSKTAAAVTINIQNNSGGTAITPGWHAIGIHD